ncbi:MAG: hypothetical protein OEW93_05050 [Candidatus Bathyarchaeota archaeon]|nr:hypothetical protein [Candidatus Bathyarchaeota archaeon]
MAIGMLEGKGKYWKTDNKLYIYVPVQVATDSAFPFKEESGYLKIRICGDKLLVECYDKEEPC